MREILTIIASAVVAVLAVLAIAPPLINWEDHRPFLDEALSRAAGMEMRSSGRITLRILPEPRLRFDQVTMMQEQREAPLLRADGVKADIALMPLFRGEFRFTDTTVSRAELVLPVAREGASLFFDKASSGFGRRWTFDNLHVSQLILTTQVVNTGRTDQILAENVHVQSGAVGGAWRLEGITSGIPFQLSTSEIDGDGHIRARLRGGNDSGVRFEVDGAFSASENNTSPEGQQASGHVRFLWNLPSKQDSGQPLVLEADFRTADQVVLLDPVSIQVGTEGTGPRFEGSGRFDEAGSLLALKLGATRVDADAFLDSVGGRDKILGSLNNLGGSGQSPNISLDIELAVDSVALAGDELTKLSLKGHFDREKANIEHLDFLAPGDSIIRLSGDVGLSAPYDIYGRISLRSDMSDRLGRYLEKLGFNATPLKILDGRKIEASSDIAFAAPIRSLYNLRIALGNETVSGNLRYTTASPGPDRLDMQMLVRGMDIAEWSAVAPTFTSLKGMDLSMLLEGYDIRYGRQAGAGQIGARVHSTDGRIIIETLDIENLAGANIHVSGKSEVDGGLQMTGRVTAEKAAPLVDLAGRFNIGRRTQLFPDVLLRNSVDLEWNTTNDGPETRGLSRTLLKGLVAGGHLDADIVTDGMEFREIALKLAGAMSRDGRGKPSLPLLIRLKGKKEQAETLSTTVEGEIAGLHFTTLVPLKIAREGGCVSDGVISLVAENTADILSSLGVTIQVMPLKARASLSCDEGAPAINVKGDLGRNSFDAHFRSKTTTDWSGNIHLGTLSLPSVLDAMILHPEAPAAGSSSWSSTRFLDHAGFRLQGHFSLQVDHLNLGNELVSQNAVMSLALLPESLAFSEMSGSFLGGRLGGKLTVSRQGGQASLIGEIRADNVALADLTSSAKMKGSLSGAMTLGSSGQNGVAMISNLGGAGEVRMDNLTIADADPGALFRLASGLMEDDDPLRDGHISSLLRKELERGSFVAEPLKAPVSIVGGVMRLGQVTMDGGASLWRGLTAFDLKNLQLDATGNLSSRASPDGWKGASPQIGLSWSGPLSALKTGIEPAPLANAIAMIVLKRETDRIQAMEAAARQRQLRAEQLNTGQSTPELPSSQP